MFSFPILKFTLRFSDVEVVAIPAVCLVNGLRLLGTSQVKLFEMHCFKMFITALCVIFLSNFDDQRTKSLKMTHSCLSMILHIRVT